MSEDINNSEGNGLVKTKLNNVISNEIYEKSKLDELGEKYSDINCKYKQIDESKASYFRIKNNNEDNKILYEENEVLNSKTTNSDIKFELTK